jgi:hypothetical protein
MRELTMDEVQEVSGAGVLWDWYQDIKAAVGDFPNLYQEAIHSTADMMCIATSKCEM